MEIPWSREARPDTGLTNGTLGMWLFLASEVMLFGALFSGYVLLRTGSTAWPHGSERLAVALASANTLILLSSGATMMRAVRAARAGSLARARLAIAATFVLALAFLGIKGYEWVVHVRAGEVPATDNFFATYYTLTGVHGLHVLGGLGALIYAWIAAGRVSITGQGRFAQRLALIALYWQFVDLVWVILFAAIYVS